MRIILATIAVLAVSVPSFAAESEAAARPFSDVPDDHWAAPAVTQLASQGILKGYPDSTFKGDRPVTRYELAVALARFAEVMEAARRPLIPENRVEGGQSVIQCPAWARSSVELLTQGQFLPKDSPIITDGEKPATAEDLAKALSSVAARMIEIETPEPDLAGPP